MSWQWYLFYMIARMTSRLQAGFSVDDPQAWIRARQQAHRVRWPARFPRDVLAEMMTIGDVLCEQFTPSATREGALIIFLHGGVVFGWDDPYRYFLAKLAAKTRITALGVDFRLPPENPYPAGVEDSLRVYERLLVERPADKLFIVADSGGGLLTISLLQRLRNLQLAQPLSVVLISPLLDLSLSGKAHHAGDPLASVDFIRGMTQFYMGSANLEDGNINPIFADLQDFPPIHIHIGSRELLLQDSVRFHERLTHVGLVSELTSWRNMYHGWHLFAPYLPEANALHETLAQSIIAYVDD